MTPRNLAGHQKAAGEARTLHAVEPFGYLRPSFSLGNTCERIKAVERTSVFDHAGY